MPIEKIHAHIRWMLRADILEVLAIETKSFEFPWTEENFMRVLRQRNCIGMVAEYNNQIVGFMIYELCKRRIHVLNFSVAPQFCRHSIGSQMIKKLIDRLTPQKKWQIILEVRETNLPAQLFFKKNGFRAISVIRDHYPDTSEDAYIMQYKYRLPETDEKNNDGNKNSKETIQFTL